MIINIWWRHRSQLVFCLFVFNSVLHEVSQLTVFSSFISFFGWTCFPYLTALGIVDATCRPPPPGMYKQPPPTHSLKHNLAQAPGKLAPDSLSSWLSSQITSGPSEAALFGGSASMALGRIQALLRNCQVQFSKSGASADTSISSQRRNVTYFPVTEIPRELARGQSNSHFKHGSHAQHPS